MNHETGSASRGAATEAVDRSGLGLYYVLFFISGIPALLYQIVWQRALFTIYGVNIESVTVIVTVFMLGLGLGSLAGGKLSTRSSMRLLRTFGLLELGIGTFGAVSLNAFHLVASITAGASTLETGIATFVLLLVPTLLMGSTLPLLAAYFVRRTGNVGESVGVLYCVNTFGSATACFAAAWFVMRALGESGSVRLAALFNGVVALSALVLDAKSSSESAIAANLAQPVSPVDAKLIPFGLGIFLAAAAGFISLAYEIIWYRLYSFVSGGVAPCFAQLLGWYLAGIAYGSLMVRDMCRQKLRDHMARAAGAAAIFMVWGNVIGFLLGPIVGQSVRHVPYTLTFPMAFIGASLLGASFPLLSHAAIGPRQTAGKRISYLYLGNIVGSASGSFLVGFILMDHWSTRAVSVILLALGALVAILLAGVAARPIYLRPSLAAGLALSAALIWFSGTLFSGMYERMVFESAYVPGFTFRYVIENRSGVIAVTRDGTVIGGGVYDGRFNTSLVHDTNAIFRAYAISAMHPLPKQVLMVGLSSGSWAQVIANNPRVERLTIVEINPGYLQLIPQYREIASLLRNPKVEIVINDARRWLVQNPERRFDLIVSNTTFHWRAHVSNLLSVEFLRLIRSHLKPGGIHYYNTTWSGEAMLTGASEFPYVLRVASFLAVSDSPISLDKQLWEASLRGYRIDGKPVFDLTDGNQRRRILEVLSLADTVSHPNGSEPMRLEPAESLRHRLKGARIITDDNMGTEWM
ncbi:MAG TPA: fused MFS/spermidine synthase [Terriglobales bacterium]|nr:fused MFS/spermidine synthase [Terriglobales bacterium]